MDEIEGALQTSFDRTTLAVYADLLQQRGDPRGELIAIDLHASAHGVTPELVVTKRRLVHDWLGDRFDPRRIRFGFYDDYGAESALDADGLRALLQSPVGAFVRGLVVELVEAAEVCDALVERPHPWLRRLALARFANRKPSPAWCAAFPQMLPNLDELAIRGLEKQRVTRMRFALDHPRVTKLVLGHSPLEIERGMFAGVREIAVQTWETIPEHVGTIADVTVYALPAYVPPNIRRVRVRSAKYAERIRRDYPHVTVDLEPRPWISLHDIEKRFLIGGQEQYLHNTIRALEHCFDDLAPDERAAWVELWTQPTTTAATAARALYALSQTRVATRPWEAMSAEFSKLLPDEVVPIDR